MEYKISLCKPSLSDKVSFLLGLQELKEKSEKDSWLYMSESSKINLERCFPTYVAALLERETNPAEGFVQDTVFWAKVGNEIVGRISIRHELNDFWIRLT